ncbi:MAG TPA: phage holin family protein [Kofleriaceae bacterium]
MEPSGSASPEPEPSFRELLADLAAETGTLVRQELALASAEMTQKAHEAARNAMWISVGVMLGAVSALVVVGAVVLALGSVIPMWVSAMVVAAAMATAAYLAYRTGRSGMRTMTFVPTETLASLGEDRAWAKAQLSTSAGQLRLQIAETRAELGEAITGATERARAAAPHPKPRSPKRAAKRKPSVR